MTAPDSAAEQREDRPSMRISRDRIYSRCVWCRGENYGPAVMRYSRGEVPCAAVAGCGRWLPEEYRLASATPGAGLDPAEVPAANDGET